jgi:anti-sigma B factor antagonist
MSAAEHADIAYVSAGEELTIYCAAQLKEDLLNQLALSQGLEIDLSQVQEMDSAGVQVLLMLKQEADARHKQLHLVNHSKPVVEIFELLDLPTHFADPLVIPAEWRKK